jgi:putative inorganic carbon (HCO3(-)) transporter
MNMSGTGFLRNNVDPRVFFSIAAALLGLVIAALVYLSQGWLWPVVIAGGLLLVWLVITHPDVGLACLVFAIYTRFSDVLEHEHGVPSFILPLALLLVGVMVLRWWFMDETIHSWEKTALLVGAYGFVAFMSLLYAADPSRSQIAWVEYAKNAFLILTVAIAMRHQTSFRYVVWALLAAGIFMGTLTVFQQLTGTFENNYAGFAQTEVKNIVGEVSDHRVAGPVGSTNFYAMILVVLVPLALDRFWHEKQGVARLAALWALVVCVLSIIFTFSRGGFIALSLVGLILLVQQTARPGRILLSLVLLLGVVQFLPRNYTERLATTFDFLPGSGNDIRNESSFRGRTSEVLVAWLIFIDHPIRGAGLNNYKHFYQEYAQPLGWDNRREERSAHNLFLEVAAETGVLGIATFGAILGTALYGLHRTRRTLLQTGSYNEASMVWALLVGLIGYLVASLFLHGAYPRFFWLLMGIALAVPQIIPARLVKGEVNGKW